MDSAEAGSNPERDSNGSLGGFMIGMNSTGQHRQHGFMLLMACVLSFAALLFAVDFSAPNDKASDDTSRSLPKMLAARQAESTPTAPIRQQSAPASQPMRAILIEAIAAKVKAAYPLGGDTALAVTGTGLSFANAKSAEAERGFQRFPAAQQYFGFARAPPVGA